MKVLRLGNSQDVLGVTDRSESIAGVSERTFAELTGEPLETVLKPLWPTDDVDRVVERWIEKENPDAVFLCFTAFWVSYPSLPLRVQRLLPFGGKQLARAGLAAAASPRLSYNAVFRSGRKLGLRMIGADYHFEPTFAAELMERTGRVILRHEPTLFVVRGPVPHYMRFQPKAIRDGAHRRVLEFDSLAEAFARRVHAPYLSYRDFDQREHPEQFVGDELHLTASGMAYRGRREGAFLAEEWLKVRAAAAGSTSGAGQVPVGR